MARTLPNDVSRLCAVTSSPSSYSLTYRLDLPRTLVDLVALSTFSKMSNPFSFRVNTKRSHGFVIKKNPKQNKQTKKKTRGREGVGGEGLDL